MPRAQRAHALPALRPRHGGFWGGGGLGVVAWGSRISREVPWHRSDSRRAVVHPFRARKAVHLPLMGPAFRGACGGVGGRMWAVVWDGVGTVRHGRSPRTVILTRNLVRDGRGRTLKDQNAAGNPGTGALRVAGPESGVVADQSAKGTAKKPSWVWVLALYLGPPPPHKLILPSPRRAGCSAPRFGTIGPSPLSAISVAPPCPIDISSASWGVVTPARRFAAAASNPGLSPLQIFSTVPKGEIAA